METGMQREGLASDPTNATWNHTQWGGDTQHNVSLDLLEMGWTEFAMGILSL